MRIRKVTVSLLSVALLFAMMIQPAAASGGVSAALTSHSGVVACQAEGQFTLTLDGVEPSPELQPVDVMLALDESGSMSSTDINRTKQASHLLIDILDGRDGAVDGAMAADRVGAVAFATTARNLFGLTSNATLAKNGISAWTAARGYTAIGDAIQLSSTHLTALDRNRVIVLMTDGVNNRGVNPVTAADAAKAEGITIYAIGLGSGIDVAQLTAIASPGKVYLAPTNEELEGVFAGIATEIIPPAATDLNYSMTLGADLALTGAVAATGSLSFDATSLSWSLDQLRTETVSLSFSVAHTGDLDGSYPVAGLLTWIDPAGVAQGMPLSSHLTVSGCNQPPVANAGPDQTVPMDETGYATVLLDGSGSIDDGRIAPLSYAWSMGGTALGAGETLLHAFPLGVHEVQLTVDDGEYTETDTVVITVVDLIAPQSQIDLAGTMGDAGWYREGVSVSVSATDNFMGSGVSATYLSTDGGGTFGLYAGPVMVVAEGITDLAAYAEDDAGNIEAPPVGAQVRIDTVAPELSAALSGDFLESGWYLSLVTVTLSAIDETSGVGSIEIDLGDGWQAYTGPVVITADGSHVVSFRAHDVAGNVTSDEVSFRIGLSCEDLIRLTERFYDEGQIRGRGILTSLVQKLEAACRAEARGQPDVADNIYEAYSNELEALIGRHVDAEAAALLLPAVQHLISHN